MKVAIVGSRDFLYPELVTTFVDQLPPGTAVVTGGARGVDTLAEQRARQRGLGVVVHPADWDKYGKGAGFLRNTTIIGDSDWVVAFWDGKSRGTVDSMQKANKASKPLTVIVAPTHTRHYNGAEPLYQALPA